MGERLSPWRPRPTQEVLELLQQVPDTVMYLVHRTGPTSFLVREDGSDIKRKVTIGARPCCSCAVPAPCGGCKELCLHLLFVMVKVLRVPPSNPLVWQLSLTDRELEEVLRCGALPEHAPPPPPDMRKAAAEKTEPGQVKRRAVDEEDPCPICYEDMVNIDPDMLVWCRFGCGRNVHGKCMGIWAEHQQRTLGKELSCPLCRGEWGEFKWKPPPPKRKKLAAPGGGGVHPGTKCGACKKAPLSGKRYRCLICADYDLCEVCFSGGHHPQHPFACKENPGAFGVPAERPVMMPVITRLATTVDAAVGGNEGYAEAAGPDAAGSSQEPADREAVEAEPSTSGHDPDVPGQGGDEAVNAPSTGAGAGAIHVASGSRRPPRSSHAINGSHYRGRVPASVAAARAAEARAAAAAAGGADEGGAELGVDAMPMTISGINHGHGNAGHASATQHASGRSHNQSNHGRQNSAAAGGQIEAQGLGNAARNTFAGLHAGSGHSNPAAALPQQQRVRKGLARQPQTRTPGQAAAITAEHRAANLDNGLQGAGVLAGGALPSSQLASDPEVVGLLEGRRLPGRPVAAPSAAFGRGAPSPMRSRSTHHGKEGTPMPVLFTLAGRSVLAHGDRADDSDEGAPARAQGCQTRSPSLPRGMRTAMAKHHRFVRAMSDGARSPDTHAPRSINTSRAASPGRTAARHVAAQETGFGLLAVGGRAVASASDLHAPGVQGSRSAAPQPGMQQAGHLVRGRPPLPRLYHAGAEVPAATRHVSAHVAGQDLLTSSPTMRARAISSQIMGQNQGNVNNQHQNDGLPHEAASGVRLPPILAVSRPHSAESGGHTPSSHSQHLDAAEISGTWALDARDNLGSAPANEIQYHPSQAQHVMVETSATILRRSMSAGAQMSNMQYRSSIPFQFHQEAGLDEGAELTHRPYLASDWRALRQRATQVQDEATSAVQLAQIVVQNRHASAEQLLAGSPPQVRTSLLPSSAAPAQLSVYSMARGSAESVMPMQVSVDEDLATSRSAAGAPHDMRTSQQVSAEPMSQFIVAGSCAPSDSPEHPVIDATPDSADCPASSMESCHSCRQTPLQDQGMHMNRNDVSGQEGNALMMPMPATAVVPAQLQKPMHVSDRGTWATLYSNPVYSLQSSSIDFSL